MSAQAFFHALQTSEVALQIGALNHIYGAIAQLFHIAGLLLLLTPILLVNLRLLGFGLTSQSVQQLAQATEPAIKLGFGLLLLSGVFIFLPSADLYYLNPAFWLKLLLIVLALLFQFTLYKKVIAAKRTPKILTVSAALLSTLLWFGVGFVGRAIGFM